MVYIAIFMAIVVLFKLFESNNLKVAYKLLTFRFMRNKVRII